MRIIDEQIKILSKKRTGGVGRAKKGEITHEKHYRIPSLETLIEMGGAGRVKEVLDRVGEKMKDILKTKDYEKLRVGIDLRWRNKAKWERGTMKNEGLIKSDSPRGIWKITDLGREYYDERK